MTGQEQLSVCHLVDLAVERCEEGNLREQLEVPRWIAELVVKLQAAAGEELQIPSRQSTRRSSRRTYGRSSWAAAMGSLCVRPRIWLSSYHLDSPRDDREVARQGEG